MKKDIYSQLQPAVSLFMKTIFNPTIEFESEIPEDEKILLVGNHVGNLDSLLLATAVYRKIHFLAKSELFKGHMKKFMESVGSIPVNRDGNDMKVITDSVNLLKDDNCVLIFPEGTRSNNIHKTDKLILPFKAGTVMIANREQLQQMREVYAKALEAQKRKILVCAGDAANDLSMLDEADLAFLAADGDPRMMDRGYRLAAACDEGTIADVIRQLEP